MENLNKLTLEKKVLVWAYFHSYANWDGECFLRISSRGAQFIKKDVGNGLSSLAQEGLIEEFNLKPTHPSKGIAYRMTPKGINHLKNYNICNDIPKNYPKCYYSAISNRIDTELKFEPVFKKNETCVLPLPVLEDPIFRYIPKLLDALPARNLLVINKNQNKNKLRNKLPEKIQKIKVLEWITAAGTYGRIPLIERKESRYQSMARTSLGDDLLKIHKKRGVSDFKNVFRRKFIRYLPHANVIAHISYIEEGNWSKIRSKKLELRIDGEVKSLPDVIALLLNHLGYIYPHHKTEIELGITKSVVQNMKKMGILQTVNNEFHLKPDFEKFFDRSLYNHNFPQTIKGLEVGKN